jgi:anti-sigma B factor antagonist
VIAVTSFSATKRCVNGGVFRLDLVGEVRGAAVDQLATLMIDAIVVDRAEELVIDLDAVSFLDAAGVWTLICGYAAAVEGDTLYRVVNARDQVHNSLQATGMLDVLADSQDVAAILLALLALPDPGYPDTHVSGLPGRGQQAG